MAVAMTKNRIQSLEWHVPEEELDFIINYDIKYRMGDKLNDSE